MLQMPYTNFQIFLKKFLAVRIEIIDLSLRAVIDSYEIWTINKLIKKIETNFIIQALFRVAQTKK